MFDLTQAPKSNGLNQMDEPQTHNIIDCIFKPKYEALFGQNMFVNEKLFWKFYVSTSAVLELPAHVGSNHVTPHVILYLYFNLHFYLYLKVRKVLPPTTLVFVFAFVFTFVFVSAAGANLTDVTPCVTLRLSVGTSNNYLTSSNPFHLYLHLYL